MKLHLKCRFYFQAKSGMKGAKGARDRLDMYIVGSVIEDLMGDRFKSRYKTDEIYFGCATCLVNSSVINLKVHEPSKGKNI